jgi:hypothetical protein
MSQMKTTTLRIMALAIITLVLGLASASPAVADTFGPYHPYTYGHNGYWDEHHGYHHWQQYNGHDGYWTHRSDGVRIFIHI